jgi:hypothetical protein
MARTSCLEGEERVQPAGRSTCQSVQTQTNLVVGSPGVLPKSILDEQHEKSRQYDLCTDTDFDKNRILSNRAIFFLGTKHGVFKDYLFPRDSVVLDPRGTFQIAE